MSLQGHTLRTTTHDDLAAVGAVLTASFAHHLPGYYGAEAVAALLPLVSKPNPRLLASGTYYCALDGNGTVAACGGWSHEAPGTGAISSQTAHIRHFATHPDYARKRLAAAIMAITIEAARAAGANRLECLSGLNAQNFYNQQGFTPVAPATPMIAGTTPMPSVLMVRDV